MNRINGKIAVITGGTQGLGAAVARLFAKAGAAPHITNFVPFSFRKSTVWLCKPDPGRRRERSGSCARAVPMGQGVGRVWRVATAGAARRARATHRPFLDEF